MGKCSVLEQEVLVVSLSVECVTLELIYSV
jgi:hypothetical protein